MKSNIFTNDAQNIEKTLILKAETTSAQNLEFLHPHFVIPSLPIYRHQSKD